MCALSPFFVTLHLLLLRAERLNPYPYYAQPVYALGSSLYNRRKQTLNSHFNSHRPSVRRNRSGFVQIPLSQVRQIRKCVLRSFGHGALVDRALRFIVK